MMQKPQCVGGVVAAALAAKVVGFLRGTILPAASHPGDRRPATRRKPSTARHAKCLGLWILAPVGTSVARLGRCAGQGVPSDCEAAPSGRVSANGCLASVSCGAVLLDPSTRIRLGATMQFAPLVQVLGATAGVTATPASKCTSALR
jgi:hypothetical protein